MMFRMYESLILPNGERAEPPNAELKEELGKKMQFFKNQDV